MSSNVEVSAYDGRESTASDRIVEYHRNAIEAERQKGEAKLAAFKEEVRHLSRDLCREQDWCDDGERKWLFKLRLKPLSREVSGRVVVEVDVNFDLASHQQLEDEANDEERIIDAIRDGNYSIRETNVDWVE